MTFQGWIVVVLTALAAAYLAWRVLGPLLGRGAEAGGCHGCSGCDLKAGTKQAPCAADAVFQIPLARRTRSE